MDEHSLPFEAGLGKALLEVMVSKLRAEELKGIIQVKVEDDNITEQRPHVPGPGRGDEW